MLNKFFRVTSLEQLSLAESSGEYVTGRGASEKRSAVGFCLGSGLFGSYNSD